MIENRWVTSESTFIDAADFDACVAADYRPMIADPTLPIYVGIDASTQHDSTALCAVVWNKDQQRVRLVTHKIIVPTAANPIDFEGAIESTVMQWANAFRIRAVLYDPYQMAATSQRLARNGVKMVEFPQTLPNVTAASQNLLELVKGKNPEIPCEEV